MNKVFRTGLFLALLICGMTMLQAEPVELTGGNLKLVVHPGAGTFCAYHIADTGKNRYEPLFEDRNYGSTSWFSIQSNGRVFKLVPRNSHSVEVVRTEQGVMLQFVLTDDFYVEQEFRLVDPERRGFPTAISMELRIENTSGKEGSFAAKALFDTMLGENRGIHFSTDTRSRISQETRILTNTDRDSLLISSNDRQSVAFHINDKNATVPEAVYIANWERLNTLNWLPDYIPGRNFNTLYSVQDSAVLFVWPERKIADKKLYVVKMLFGPYVIKDVVARPAVQTDPDSTVDTHVPVQPVAATAPVIYPELSVQPKTEDERIALIEWILGRIEEIEIDPSVATDDELDYLNRTLDTLLEQRIPE